MDNLLTFDSLHLHNLLHDFARQINHKSRSGLLDDWRNNVDVARAENRAARENEVEINPSTTSLNSDSKKRGLSTLHINADAAVSNVSEVSAPQKKARPTKPLPGTRTTSTKSQSPPADPDATIEEQPTVFGKSNQYGGLEDEDASLEREAVVNSPIKGRVRAPDVVSSLTFILSSNCRSFRITLSSLSSNSPKQQQFLSGFLTFALNIYLVELSHIGATGLLQPMPATSALARIPGTSAAVLQRQICRHAGTLSMVTLCRI
jgi:hypothetical protein